jgi:uroporphyrinogen decarboxylase
MSDHIDLVKNAIEFKKPDHLPLETPDLPGIYNHYYTKDENDVTLIPGAENFDSAWILGSWFPCRQIGRNDYGEVVRIDEYGIESIVPKNDTTASYIISHSPLHGKNSLGEYKFPDPEWGNFFFENLEKQIKDRYYNRFISAHIDPAAFLMASFLMGTEYMYLKLADNVKFVVSIIEGIFDYHKKLIKKFKKAGVHMLTYLDEFASNQGMMFSPEIWRKYFKNFYKDWFKCVHEEGLYTGLGLDGNFVAIIDDILEMEVDVLQLFDTKSFGVDRLEGKVKGKICIKCGVDMSQTLFSGTAKEVELDAVEKVERLFTREGGFIAVALKWNRPESPKENYIAATRAFNKFR